MSTKIESTKDIIVEGISKAIFAIRWLLAPMYLLLYVALALYLYKYAEEIFHMMVAAPHTEGRILMLGVIELIDMTMIANLVVMTTTGGYSIFVREFTDLPTEDRPRWLNKNFSSSEQKIKLGGSLIGVAMVNLLPKFIEAEKIPWDVIAKQGVIVGIFIFGTLAFCWINLLMHHPSLAHATTSEDQKEKH